MITIALADDHALMRESLAHLINGFGDYRVIWQAANGEEVLKQLDHSVPDLLLLDVRMPRMDGFETCKRVVSRFPDLKVLVLSMMEEEMAIIRMLKYGARGYILKDTEAATLKSALHTLYTSGFYFNDLVTGRMIHALRQKPDGNGSDGVSPIHLSEKEVEFLKHASTELTYKEIADLMNLSPRTIDGYRDGLFAKLHIKSRVGLAMYAVRPGLVKVENI